MKMKYSHIINQCYSSPWAITHTKLLEVRSFLLSKANDTHDIAAYMDDKSDNQPNTKARPAADKKGAVAVLPVFGIINQRVADMDVSSGGMFSIDKFTKTFRNAVADPNIKAIVLNIDSPGGGVFGVMELAEEIYKARSQTHIVAVANSLAASAAYWIASAADEVVVTPGGMVGSIGVYMMHDDLSAAYEAAGIKTTIIQAGKYKTEGNSLQPLTDEARAALQADVDAYYDMFIDSVAKGRGIASKTVREGYGQGRVLNAKDAKAEGMVDRIDTLDGVLARLGAAGGNAQKTNMAMAGKKLALLGA